MTPLRPADESTQGLKVRLVVDDLGEVKEWAMEGKDDVVFSSWDEQTSEVFWQIDSLPLALNLVPDVMDAIERARGRGDHVEVHVTSSPWRASSAPAASRPSRETTR